MRAGLLALAAVATQASDLVLLDPKVRGFRAGNLPRTKRFGGDENQCGDGNIAIKPASKIFYDDDLYGFNFEWEYDITDPLGNMTANLLKYDTDPYDEDKVILSEIVPLGQWGPLESTEGRVRQFNNISANIPLCRAAVKNCVLQVLLDDESGTQPLLTCADIRIFSRADNMLVNMKVKLPEGVGPILPSTLLNRLDLKYADMGLRKANVNVYPDTATPPYEKMDPEARFRVSGEYYEVKVTIKDNYDLITGYGNNSQALIQYLKDEQENGELDKALKVEVTGITEGGSANPTPVPGVDVGGASGQTASFGLVAALFAVALLARGF